MNWLSLNFSVTIRRLGITLALAVVLVSGLALLINEDVAGLSFLPSWGALFFAWPYLNGRLRFPNFPKPPAPPKPRVTNWRRLVITAVLSVVLAFGLALLIHGDVFGLSFLLFWLGLFYGWPYLSQRIPFLNSLAEATPSQARSADPKRPLWLRLIRGTVAFVGATALAIFLLSLIVIVPIALCHRRAQKVHDAIHIGMTVPEVLQAATDCDVFQASSEFPHNDDTDPDNIPAMSLGWSKDGTYHTYDPATNQTLHLSESEALNRLHAKLHDGYRWHFHYNYINMTPQHVSFSVVFGADGRVTEVKPVYGWD
jgi:hypothetical protein